MKKRCGFSAIVCLLILSIRVPASVSSEAKREHLRMLRSGAVHPASLSSMDQAYLDAMTLLNQTGTCSDFFGGPRAQSVLEKLVVELQQARISDSRIGIRMHGPIAYFHDMETGLAYRMFAHAEVNTEGPFCKAGLLPSQPSVPDVGSFAPNTRQARALILLHELAHLIQGKGADWLIPDDGDLPQLSDMNTKIIESKCGDHIRRL